MTGLAFVLGILSTDKGAPSFMRTMGVPILLAGIFGFIWSIVTAYTQGLNASMAVIFMGLSGKLIQKPMEG